MTERSLDDRKRIFNYRSSRFRRISENAFGILTNRFRIFHTKINLRPDKVVTLVSAAVVLHNMLRSKSRDSYTPIGFADEISTAGGVMEGTWREDVTQSIIVPMQAQYKGNKSKKEAETIRENLADYFFGPGQVKWQWKCLF